MEPLSPKSLDLLSGRSERAKGVHQGICADVSKLILPKVTSPPSPNPAPLWLLFLGLRDPIAGTPWHKRVPARLEPIGV